MAPAKQAKVIQEFQKQSAQMDMTVRSMFKITSLVEISRLTLGSIFVDCNGIKFVHAD